MKVAALVAVLVAISAPSRADDEDPHLGDKLAALELHALGGELRTRYSGGAEAKAREIESLVAQGRAFYKRKLALDVPLEIAVLSRADWERVTAVPYGMPFVTEAGIMLMPATSDGVVEQPMLAGKPPKPVVAELAKLHVSYERAAAIGVELVGLHELGHVYARAYGIAPAAHWMDELVASYVAYAFFAAERPGDARVWLVVMGSAPGTTPPTHTSLDDFEQLYLGVGANDYVWYQAQFIRQCAAVYGAKGLGFLADLKAAFPGAGPAAPPLGNPRLLARLDRIAPGFVTWAARTFPAR